MSYTLTGIISYMSPNTLLMIHEYVMLGISGTLGRVDLETGPRIISGSMIKIMPAYMSLCVCMKPSAPSHENVLLKRITSFFCILSQGNDSFLLTTESKAYFMYLYILL
jgi:hypothetical protein